MSPRCSHVSPGVDSVILALKQFLLSEIELADRMLVGVEEERVRVRTM